MSSSPNITEPAQTGSVFLSGGLDSGSSKTKAFASRAMIRGLKAAELRMGQIGMQHDALIPYMDAGGRDRIPPRNPAGCGKVRVNINVVTAGFAGLGLSAKLPPFGKIIVPGKSGPET